MALMNCWEIKKCGRERGGLMESELGPCPACPECGHSCWMISGTLCGGKVQGSFASKEMNCLNCEVFKLYNIRTGTLREQLAHEHKAELARYLNKDAEVFNGMTAEEALHLAVKGLDLELEGHIQERVQELLVMNKRLLEEIAERKRAEETIRHMAYHDSLTNLPNRVMLEDRLRAEISRTQRSKDSLAVLFIDLDRFKTINDTLGHEVGDLLLQSVAQRVRGCLRQYDILSRFGGDEFVAVLPKVRNPKHAAMLARRIIEAVKLPIALDTQKLYITLSIGIAVYPGDGDECSTLLKYADTAMYKAKELGRNNFQFYEPDMNLKLMQFAKLEGALSEAIEQNQLRLEYQPQVDLKTGKMIAAEALIRWDHPEHGVVSPLDFIPLAEETGLIIPIGQWVIETACRQAVAWQKSGYAPLRIAVNLSARQFRQKVLQQMILKVLDETGLDPQWLDLEITESEIMKDTANAVNTLRDLRDKGISVSLDDFGTGYSSLNYLKVLPVSTVKIDRGFIKNLPDNETDVVIAKAIITMAHCLGLNVVAEGVETEGQLELLKRLDCDMYQGFLFSRPIRPEKLEALFNDLQAPAIL